MLGLTLLLQISALMRVDDPIRTHQDILGYTFEVTVPDTGDNIRALATIEYLVAAPGHLLILDLADALRVLRVVSGDADVGFVHTGDSLMIDHWGEIGDSLEVSIEYDGQPADGLLIRPNARGRRSAFADNWPNRAHEWIPTEDHPSDKAAVSWVIDVPGGWSVVANGEFVSRESLEGGRSVWRYVESRPIATYNYVFGAGELTVAEVGSEDGLPQTIWAYAEDSAYAIGGPFRRVSDIVKTIADLVGPFPYQKLAHVQSSTRFGGMENAGAIFYAEQGYVRQSLDEGLVVHEVAHQWFGDAVTEYDWHHLWLSEGFATYFAALYYDLKGETGTFSTRLAQMRSAYLASNVVDRPILDFGQRDYLGLLNANNYQKGGMVLHMLRREIGDSAFFGGLRAFYDQYRDSTALSADFQMVMEAAAGRDLGPFFVQWLTQPGYPILDVVAHRLEDGRIRIDIEEVQPEAWGRFVLDLRVDIRGSDGARTTVTVPLRDGAASVTLTPPPGSEMIEIDAEGDLLLVARTSWRD